MGCRLLDAVDGEIRTVFKRLSVDGSDGNGNIDAAQTRASRKSERVDGGDGIGNDHL